MAIHVDIMLGETQEIIEIKDSKQRGSLIFTLKEAEEVANVILRLTKRASDGLESPAKKQPSTAGSKSPAKKRKVTSRA